MKPEMNGSDITRPKYGPQRQRDRFIGTKLGINLEEHMGDDTD